MFNIIYINKTHNLCLKRTGMQWHYKIKYCHRDRHSNETNSYQYFRNVNDA